jgi:CheY-like chemotaxis protein
VYFARNLSAAILLAAIGLPCVAQQPVQPAGRSDQPYRDYFRKPETPQEYWAALNYEIAVGKYDLAAQELKGFLSKNPSDEDLLQIEEKEGLSSFLRLLAIPELRDDAKPLVERVTAAVKRLRRNPERIAGFVKNLSASPAERAYAMRELQKAGPVAVPFLIGALETNASSEARAPILLALVEMGPDAAPALAAALSIEDADLQLQLLDVLRRRAQTEAVPFLWFVSASDKYAPLVRDKAKEVIAYLLGIERALLPSATAALTKEAERYYEHQVRFGDPQAVTIWEWDGNHVVGRMSTASQAEEYYGLLFAGQALKLDPGYVPAQVVFLSLTIDKAFERAMSGQPSPEVRELVKTINPQLLNQTLARALDDHRVPVIVGCITALGEFGDAQSLTSTEDRQPPLARALYYPDRRVEMAAADAFLRTPGSGNSHHATRVLAILSRMAEIEMTPTVVIASPDADQANALAKVLRDQGFATHVEATGRRLLERLHQSADADLVFLDQGIVDPLLPNLLAQLRSDADYGLLPVILTAPADRQGNIPADLETRLERIIRPYRNIWVMAWTIDPIALRAAIGQHLREAQGPPLNPQERKSIATGALGWLARISTRQVPGYEILPAQDAILHALQREDLARIAVDATTGLPGRRVQHELLITALRSTHPEIQAAAATQLARHIEEHHSALSPDEVRGLTELFAAAKDPGLKSALALVLGSLHPDARVTGQRLESYRPRPASPAPPAPAKTPADQKEGEPDK